MKFASHTDPAVGANGAMVFLHNLFTQGQSDACSRIFPGCMHAPEHFKDPFRIYRIKAYTVVRKVYTYKIHLFRKSQEFLFLRVNIIPGDLNDRLDFTELNGIVDQV
jgi:hypothetical protein